MRLIFSFFLTILVNVALIAQDGSLDLTFNPTDIGFKNGDGPYSEIQNPTTYIHKVAVQSDGKILAGGIFREYNGSACRAFTRLNTDGTFDSSLTLGAIISEVRAIVIQPDGKIIVGGLTSDLSGYGRKTIIRLNSNGTLDTTFNVTVGQESWVTLKAIALQPDGKVLMAISDYPYIVRVDANGMLDTTFNSTGIQGTGGINSIALQSDGKLIVGGSFTGFGGVVANRLARLNSNGSIDVAFDTTVGANNSVSKIVVLSNDKILMIGSFDFYNGSPRTNIARLNADGVLDSSFIPGTFYENFPNRGTLTGITVQSDGKILIGGKFNRFGTTTVSNVVRLNASGSRDTTYNSAGTDDYIYDFATLSDNKIIAVGLFETHDNVARRRITRSFANGSIDMSFNTGSGANGGVSDSMVLSDGKIIIAGDFRLYNGVVRNRIAKLNSDGTLDMSFNSSSLINAAVDVFGVQSDGKIVIGGNFTKINGFTTNRIARLNADGSVDFSFYVGSGFSGTWITDIAIQNDGKIIVVGYFTAFNGVACNRIVRLNTDGSLDTTFNVGTGPNDYVGRIAIQSDGKIIVCGSFTTFNGASRKGILRLNADGSIDPSFSAGTGLNGGVQCIAEMPDGKILIGGSFQTYNGIYPGQLFRINHNGTYDNTFYTVSSRDSVNSFAVQTDGKIVVGGADHNTLGITIGFLTRIGANGSSDSSWSGSIVGYSFFKPYSSVYSLALQSDGKIIIGGSFDSYDNVGKNRLARLNNAGALAVDDYGITLENVIVYEENNTLYVDSKSKILKSVFVYDLSGKLVYENQNVTTAKFAVEKIKHNNQMLIFKFVDRENKIFNLKSIF